MVLVVYTGLGQSDYRLRIFAADGKMIEDLLVKPVNGQSKLNLTQANAGLYYVQLSNSFHHEGITVLIH